jgi:hypothetical protein
MTSLSKRLLSSTPVIAPLVLWSGVASANPACPTAALKTCNDGRQVGDVIIAFHAAPVHLLGLNPGTGNFYEFSVDSTFESGTTEGGDLLVEPANPLHSLLIGDVNPALGQALNNNAAIGIVEFDQCGSIVSTSNQWATFANLPPGDGLSGTNNRMLAADPITGWFVSPGDKNYLFEFPPLGGADQLNLMTDTVPQGFGLFGTTAFDPLGNLFRADDSGLIARFPASTLSSPPLVGATVSQTGI